MKAVCPNDVNHDKFLTIAYEMHEWLVDEKGQYLDDNGCIDVSVWPQKENHWQCAICGSEAKVDG
jgi:hypothetical protein